MEKGLISKAAYKRYSTGHPWIFANEITNKHSLPPRACAFLFGDTWWLHSPESFIRLRRLGPPQVKWMYTPKFNMLTNTDQFISYFGDWLMAHLVSTLARKMKMLNLEQEDVCLRWIFSENDFLPGLIVDIFGDTVVCQINSAPVEVFWHHIRRTIEAAYQNVTTRKAQIIELRNAPVRKKEGLDVIAPEATTAPMTLRWNNFKWQMTPGGTQKTGAYFDQRDNHLQTAQYAEEFKYRTAWDLCTYQGGFALHLLAKGLQVTGVDQSAAALEQALKNIELNSLPADHFIPACADIFAWLRQQSEQNNKADLIILDPPSFVKSRDEVQPAIRGYRELNTLALKALTPGGMLVSCVCSHHITPKIYETVLKEAAHGANVKIQVLKTQGPSLDHAPTPGFTEGHYLQAWFVHIMP